MARRKKASDAAALAVDGEGIEIPASAPVDRDKLLPGYRARHDGWTQERTQLFFDALRHTGCVEDACRYSRMSSVGARRLKEKFAPFAREWDAALAQAHRGLVAIAYERAVKGKETIIIRKGEEYERRISPSDAILGMLLKQGEGLPSAGSVPAEDAITYDEWQDGWYFDEEDDGKKRKSDPGAKARVMAKLNAMRQRILDDFDSRGICRFCTQSLPEGVSNHGMVDEAFYDVPC